MNNKNCTPNQYIIGINEGRRRDRKTMVKYNSLADRKSAATGLVNVFAVANILERNLPIHKILIFAAAIVPVFSEPNRFATAIFPANVPVKPFCPGTILTQITRHIFYTHAENNSSIKSTTLFISTSPFLCYWLS